MVLRLPDCHAMPADSFSALDHCSQCARCFSETDMMRSKCTSSTNAAQAIATIKLVLWLAWLASSVSQCHCCLGQARSCDGMHAARDSQCWWAWLHTGREAYARIGLQAWLRCKIRRVKLRGISPSALCVPVLCIMSEQVVTPLKEVCFSRLSKHLH